MAQGGVQQTDSMGLLQNLLKRDELINGVELYKQGEDLKNGLIDIDKVYELVIEKETAND
jgi:hypothetical protein